MSAAHGRRGMDILERRIAPGAFHDSGRKYEPPKCHLRTRSAILSLLSAWVDDAQHRGCGILWLYGPPGAGKSSLAQTIAQVSFERGLLAASFFFDRNTPGLNTEKHLMATLAHQISNTVPEAGRYIAEAVERDPGVFQGSLESQLQALIVGPLLAAHAAHNASLAESSTSDTTTVATTTKPPPPKKWARLLVIDALDSCHGAAVQRYIVRILSTALIHKRVPLFILVASRPLPPIRDSFNSYDLRDLLLTLPLDDRAAYLPDAEIKRYLWSRFEYIRMTHPLRAYVPASWPSQQVVQMLVARAAGQFVYASSVVKYVDSAQHRPVDRLDAVLRIVPGLGGGLGSGGALGGASASASAGGGTGGNGEVPFAELDALYRHVLGGVANAKAVLRILGAILFAQRLFSARAPPPTVPPASLPSSLAAVASSASLSTLSAPSASNNNNNNSATSPTSPTGGAHGLGQTQQAMQGEGTTPIPVTDPRFLEEILGLSRGDVPFVLQDLHSIVYVPPVGAAGGAGGDSSSTNVGGGGNNNPNTSNASASLGGSGGGQGSTQSVSPQGSGSGSGNGNGGTQGQTGARRQGAGPQVQREATVVPAHGGGIGTPTATTQTQTAGSGSSSSTGTVPVMHALHPASMGIQPGTQVVAYGSAAAQAHTHSHSHSQSNSASYSPATVAQQQPYSGNTQAYGTVPYAPPPPAAAAVRGRGAGQGGQVQAYGAGADSSTGGPAVGGGGGTEPVLVAYTRGGQQFSARGSPQRQSQSTSRSPTGGEPDRGRDRDGGERAGSAGRTPAYNAQGHAHGTSVSGGSAAGSPVRRATHPHAYAQHAGANGDRNGSVDRDRDRDRLGHGRGGHAHAHGAYRAHPYDVGARHAGRSPPVDGPGPSSSRGNASSHMRGGPQGQQQQYPYAHPLSGAPPSRRLTASSSSSGHHHHHAQGHAHGNNNAHHTTSGTVSTAPATSTGIRILHSSLIDFLTDRSRAGRYFINSVKVHAELARSCVRNLLSGHKYVHQYAGQALVTHCRYSVLTHELHTDLMHFDLGVWIETCKTWSDGGYGESVYADADSARGAGQVAGGRAAGDKEDVPRLPGYAVGPYDQAWLELPGLFHWFKTLTYTDPAKDLHTIHTASWEHYLLSELPRYTEHPGLEALLVFASLPPDPVSFTTPKAKYTTEALSTSPTTTSPTTVISPTTTSPTVVVSPTSATTIASGTTLSTPTSASTSAWSFDWLHVWPLLGIAPRDAAALEAGDRAALHLCGLKPGGGFDAYRGMLQEFLCDRKRAGAWAVVGGGVGDYGAGDGESEAEKEERRRGAETVARVAESVCRYLMEPKKAGQIYPYRLPSEWTWFRAGHDDSIFRENRTKETFQAGLVYLPFLLMHAARSETLIAYLRMRDVEGTHTEERIRSIDMIRAKELPRLAWAEDKERAEEAVRAYLAKCEGHRETEEPNPTTEIVKAEADTMMQVDQDAIATLPDAPAVSTVNGASDGPEAESESMDVEAAPTVEARTPTPRPPSTSLEPTTGADAAATTNTPTPTTTATPSADADVDVNPSEHVQANTSGDVDMDADGESDADADADADADTDPDAGEDGVLEQIKQEDEMDTDV